LVPELVISTPLHSRRLERAKTLKPQINARVETAATKPTFADSFHGRHCPVLADGFYECKNVRARSGVRKQPYRFALKTGERLQWQESVPAKTEKDRRLIFAILNIRKPFTVMQEPAPR
jgi:putative SOS response-associated peptidase YedK